MDKHQKPKYILKHKEPERAVFFSKPSTLLPSSKTEGTQDRFDIVLSEDVLSAIRIGRHTASCSLLGTAVNIERITEILHSTAERAGMLPPDRQSLEWYRDVPNALNVGVWLDPDKAGRKATRRLAHSLSMQGHKVTLIKSDKDPKLYSDNQIRSILLDRHSIVEAP